MLNINNEDRGLKTVDYNLQGLVGIRLVNAAPTDAATVRRQIGLLEGKLDREPDITIRFVDKLSTTSRIRYLGVDDAGYTEDAFLMLRSKHKSRAKVQIPFEQVGQNCEIVCERGLPAIPLLMPILNLTALNKGILPIHAAAFTYNGSGALVTGWAKGGKTTALLAFMSNGAEYIGDDWIYVSGDGQHMYGIPEPIHLWDYHLADLPEYRARVKRGDRLRLRGLGLLTSSMDWAVSRRLGRGSPPAKLMKRLTPILKRQLNVEVPPRELFLEGFGSLMGNLDKVFFVVSHEHSDTTLERIDPQELAQRMGFSLQVERSDFMSYYMKFRFAFPSIRNELIEEAEALQRDSLREVMAGKETYLICHPYPVSISALYEIMRPVLL